MAPALPLAELPVDGMVEVDGGVVPEGELGVVLV